MVKSCAAFGCTNRATRTTDSHLKFFKFPTDPIKLKAWLCCIRRVDEKGNLWKPGKHSFLCSDHFKPEDMYKIKDGVRTLLKDEALPTVFNSSPYRPRKNAKQYKQKNIKDERASTKFISSTRQKKKHCGKTRLMEETASLKFNSPSSLQEDANLFDKTGETDKDVYIVPDIPFHQEDGVSPCKKHGVKDKAVCKVLHFPRNCPTYANACAEERDEGICPELDIPNQLENNAISFLGDDAVKKEEAPCTVLNVYTVSDEPVLLQENANPCNEVSDKNETVQIELGSPSPLEQNSESCKASKYQKAAPSSLLSTATKLVRRHSRTQNSELECANQDCVRMKGIIAKLQKELKSTKRKLMVKEAEAKNLKKILLNIIDTDKF